MIALGFILGLNPNGACRLAGGSAQTAAIAWTDMLSPQPRSNTPTRQEPALAMAGGTASVSTAGDGGSGVNPC